MSFTFQWPRFSDQFHSDAIQMLNNALNKGDKPPIIADRIEVVELEMGTQPPELEIRDIGDLTVDQFRGIFRLTYAGDAHLVLKTKVQANPLNHKQPDIHLMTGSRGMLAAREPLAVPMLLRLSHFRLHSYVVLVVSKHKGITLVFKTDPLQNVDINSTFDSIAVIQNFIQREIEGQLRQMFREDLPGIIHRLSQQWVQAKVEAPYLDARPPSDTRSVSAMSVDSLARRTTRSAPPTFHLTDDTDPTYGLRPEGLPAFANFGRLFKQNKGLAGLTEESEYDVDDDESALDGTTDTPFFHSTSSHIDIDTPPTDPSHSSRPSTRRFSASSSSYLDDTDPIITVNNTLHQLSTLTSSNHTFSPYTRSLAHFAVRSAPQTRNTLVRAPPERRPVKATRKRTHRIGGKAPEETRTRTPSPSPPPSEFDPSEIDRYFRAGDDASVDEQDADVPGAMPRYRTPSHGSGAAARRERTDIWHID